MKKTFFLLFLLWITLGASMAQDIYTSGYCFNTYDRKEAAVFKNDAILYLKTEVGRDLSSPAMVIDTLTDDIYWACNSNPLNSISNGYGFVMKNDEVLLDNVLGTGINAISLDGNDLYSAGYFNDIYESVGAVWKNGDITPLYTYGDTMRQCEILGVVAVDGTVYACGYYVDDLTYGCVWINDDLYASYPNQKVVDITFENGVFYYLVEDFDVTVYASGQAYFSLHANAGYAIVAYDFKVANGDVYTVGFMGFNDCCVWKNDELLYLHPYSRAADIKACQIYGQSLYYAGWDDEDHGIVFKDGEQIASTKYQYYYDIFIRPDVLDMDEVNTENIAISPNPAKESITINGLDRGEKCSIFNAVGQLVMTVKADSDNRIDVSELSSGLYLIHCGDHVLRFVKE